MVSIRTLCCFDAKKRRREATYFSSGPTIGLMLLSPVSTVVQVLSTRPHRVLACVQQYNHRVLSRISELIYRRQGTRFKKSGIFFDNLRFFFGSVFANPQPTTKPPNFWFSPSIIFTPLASHCERHMPTKHGHGELIT